MSDLAILASKMMLTPDQAVALPAVVERAASDMGMTSRAMMDQCFRNAELREYLATVCRKVAA